MYQDNLTASEALEVALVVTWRWGQLSKRDRRAWGELERAEKGRNMAQPQAGMERKAEIHTPP